MGTLPQPRWHDDPLLIAIASSAWSQAQRRALALLAAGRADHTEHFVPACWNRIAKARAGLRELEKAGILARDPGGRLFLIESGIAASELGTPTQLALPEEPLLGAALAAVSRLPEGEDKGCPVRPGTDGPSWDGQNRPSQDGRDPPRDGAEVYALSVLGRTEPPDGPAVPPGAPLPHTPSSQERLNAEPLSVERLADSAFSALSIEEENELMERIAQFVGAADMAYWGADWRINWVRR